MGYPADDIIEDEPIRGDLPEYEQSVEKIDTVDETDEIEENDNLDETKKYDGYEA